MTLTSPPAALSNTGATADRLAPVPAIQQTPMIQFVAPDGTPTAIGRGQRLEPDLARSLYRDMTMARALDTEALALQRQGQLSLWLQCLGQEAAQVGSIRALDDSDMVFPSYREHAVALCRGITPRELLLQWRGAAHGGWVADERRMHLYSLVLGTQTLHATGYAMGSKLAGDDTLVAVYFGDGSASEGDVSEAFNWAAALGLPVLFICQNNQWAISTPTSSQYGEPVHRRATGFGIRSWFVDGNDALAVHAVTREAAGWVRAGGGPALVEAFTFRMAGHSTSDDPKRYRCDFDVEQWKARDPLLRVQRFLRAGGTDDSWFSGIAADAKDFALEVRKQCTSIQAPTLDEMFDQVYSTPHPLLAAERRRHREFRRLVDALGEDA